MKVLAKKHNFRVEKIKKEPAWGKMINSKYPRWQKCSSRMQHCVGLTLMLNYKYNTEKLNSWIGTVGAVKNKTSLIGIGHLKVIYPYWLAMDFAGNLGMQETRMAQRMPRPVPSYNVKI